MIEVSDINKVGIPCSGCGKELPKHLLFKQVLIKSQHGFSYSVLCPKCREELIKKLKR